MFKIIRIVILLIIFASVASTVLLQKNISRDWQGTLNIRVIPVIADHHQQTIRFVDTLTLRDFDVIQQYLNTQAKRYNIDLQHSVNIQLEEPITQVPPAVPISGASRISIILWSLKLKWWAWKNQLEDHSISQIRLYMLYQSPESKQALPHSTGLQNGLIGLINARAFSSQRTLHQVIAVHELLHILGASDKYSLRSGQPNFPDGYVSPKQRPLFPQRFAEIMARAAPVSDTKSKIATHLRQTTIGVKTAQEIGWLKTLK